MLAGSPGVEVGMVGREGMLGKQLALGVGTTPLRVVVQGSGEALRAGTVAFRRELARNLTLQRTIDRYIAVVLVQLTTSAVCLRFHQIGPRLARWLLMSRDRTDADTFCITHEFLAYMLVVRRAGVTAAATKLHRAGLIEYRRLDRSGLEAAACPCYALDAAPIRSACGSFRGARKPLAHRPSRRQKASRRAPGKRMAARRGSRVRQVCVGAATGQHRTEDRG